MHNEIKNKSVSNKSYRSNGILTNELHAQGVEHFWFYGLCFLFVDEKP